jgi:SAM-dependent methyltransferase
MAGSRSGRAAGHDRDLGSFDRRAASYERDWRSAFHAPVVAAAAEVALAALPDPAAVLDVGCGTGALLRTVAGRLPAGVELAGVDPAPAMLEVGRAALAGHPRVRLARAVAERLPFRDAAFDLVVTTVSFAHWADQPAGLAEIARVLRPGGRLVLADLFAIGWLRPVTALGRRRDRVHTPAELEAMFANAGLAPIAWERVYDLGPLPLVRAVVAARGYSPGGNR